MWLTKRLIVSGSCVHQVRKTEHDACNALGTKYAVVLWVFRGTGVYIDLRAFTQRQQACGGYETWQRHFVCAGVFIVIVVCVCVCVYVCVTFVCREQYLTRKYTNLSEQNIPPVFSVVLQCNWSFSTYHTSVLVMRQAQFMVFNAGTGVGALMDVT